MTDHLPRSDHLDSIPARAVLADVKVLAIEQLLALPYGTQVLADFGADVIGVEPVEFRESEIVPWRLRTGRHKRRIAVRLDDPRGQEIVRKLSHTVDVVAENYRPGVMDRYGLGYEQLREGHESLVYVSVSGYGHADVLPSPYSDLAAYGPIGEAMGGVTHSLLGGGFKGFIPGALGDIVSSLYATIGLLIALHHRDRTGEGQYVDVSMADSLLTISEMNVLRHTISADGWARERPGGAEGAAGRTGMLVGGHYPASDGMFVVIALTSRHLAKVAEFLGHPEWVELDASLHTADERRAAADMVVAPVIAEWASQLTKIEAARILRELGLAAAPVLAPADIVDEPHFAHRRMIDQVLAQGRTVRVVGNPVKLSSVEGARPAQEPPAVIARPGDHTRDVLRQQLGMLDGDVQALIEAGIVAD